jgi:hypothetical protein
LRRSRRAWPAVDGVHLIELNGPELPEAPRNRRTAAGQFRLGACRTRKGGGDGVPTWQALAESFVEGALAGALAYGGLRACFGPRRLSQDILVSLNAPRVLRTGRSIGRASHNRALQNDIAALPRGATDVPVNQQQVNAAGQRVGINRPDLQYTLNGKRYYVEYEGTDNPRGLLHELRTMANDPGGKFKLRKIP